MKPYIDRAHALGLRVKIYYTVRELSNSAPEIFALRSLGHEFLSNGPGGRFSWLQEHLGDGYIDRLWFGEYFDYDSPPPLGGRSHSSLKSAGRLRHPRGKDDRVLGA